jgi:hypothetical protein
MADTNDERDAIRLAKHLVIRRFVTAHCGLCSREEDVSDKIRAACHWLHARGWREIDGNLVRNLVCPECVKRKGG